MEQTVLDYYMSLPKHLHFVNVPEQSGIGNMVYRMLSEYGTGFVQIMDFHKQFLIVIADFTPNSNFEKVSEIQQEYLEISQFETDSSSFKIGGRKICRVDTGICCYANTRKAAYAFCEAGKPTRFTKIIITREYFDHFLHERYDNCFEFSRNALDYLVKNPNSPELNFVFQQIRDCPAVGTARSLYMEGKVMEMLSLVTHNLEQEKSKLHLPVKLDKRDKRSLSKIITFMKKDLSAYPSTGDLSRIANMSASRFQMAFRQVYGTTAYAYLKMMRMNYALLLLQDSDDNIRTVAAKVGYHNSGHFAKLFKETFGMGPQEYRNIHHIK